MSRRSDKAPFTPTPEQIRRGCAKIQAEWDDENDHRVDAYKQVETRHRVARLGRKSPSIGNEDFGE
jgi:hypothetical protein